MKWHEWLLLAFLLAPTVGFVACAVFYMVEPFAGVFQRRRAMSGLGQ